MAPIHQTLRHLARKTRGRSKKEHIANKRLDAPEALWFGGGVENIYRTKQEEAAMPFTTFMAEFIALLSLFALIYLWSLLGLALQG